MKTKLTLFVLTIATLFACNNAPKETADTIYTNGKIYTVNETQPWGEAVAIKDGKFIKVGTTKDVEALAGEYTTIIDLEGQFVLPGINDMHHHGNETSTDAINSNILTLTDDEKTTPEGIVAGIKKFAESHSEIQSIFVNDYANGMFPGDNGPKELLDAADNQRPIIVMSQGGHAMWGNTKALEKAGISDDTVDPEFGVIARKEGSKEPLGTVHESAMQLFWALIDNPTKAQIKEGFKHHTARINAMGITGVRIAGVMQDQLDVALEMDENNELNAYHNLAFHWRTSYIARKDPDLNVIRKQILESKNTKSKNVSSGSLKYYADGAPSSKTAFLLEDYEGDSGNRGKLQMDSELFKEEFAFWTKNGITTMTHTVGDAGTRAVLDAIEEAQKEQGKNGIRHHMTHTVMVAPSDLPRFKALGMVVDLSPAIAAPMAFHDAYKHNYGKQRHEQFFPGRGLIDAGADFMLSSDYPVGPDNPWVNIEVWTTRMHPNGAIEGTLGVQSAITLEEAIRAYTIGGAYGLYMENELGSIEIGKRASFVVLNQNLFEILPTDISETKVLKTIFNGKEVYVAK